jgi:hypothetical protein
MAKAKTKAKRSPKSPAKAPVRRNARDDQALSSDPIAKATMRKRPKRTQKQPAPQPAQGLPPAGTDRVIAEWDKVDAALDKVAAALTEFARTERNQALPLLTIKELATGEQRAWAVVSGDPQTPLTEQQAREIVATMQSLRPPASIGIAAE